MALPGAHSASLLMKRPAGQLEQIFHLDKGQAPNEAVLQWAAFDARSQCLVAVSSGTLLALINALTDDSPKSHPLQVMSLQQTPAESSAVTHRLQEQGAAGCLPAHRLACAALQAVRRQLLTCLSMANLRRSWMRTPSPCTAPCWAQCRTVISSRAEAPSPLGDG